MTSKSQEELVGKAKETFTSNPITNNQLAGKPTPLALAGALLIAVGVGLYTAGALAGALRALFLQSVLSRSVIELVLWYSALPIVVGAMFFLADLRTVSRKRAAKQLVDSELENQNVTVALTAYNDELSIAASVQDFLSQKNVVRVIVISNNSSDKTEANALAAGAIVFNEPEQGYGACVRRAMREAAVFDDTAIVAICEGDMTFRAYDLDKMVPYLRHSDVVNGTRIVETLQERATQITMFMHYGNLAVAKLLELKYFGDATLTDVGTTFKLLRRDKALQLLPLLSEPVNLEFNPYLMEQAIRAGFRFVEVPITFHQRVGVSKGGNISNSVAIKVGTRMILGILIGWRRIIVR